MAQHQITIDTISFGFWKQKVTKLARPRIFSPTYSTMPTVSNKEYAMLTAKDLINALKNIQKMKTFKLKPKHKEIIVTLAKLYNNALPPTQKNKNLDNLFAQPLRVNAQPPRVKTQLSRVRTNNISQPNMTEPPVNNQPKPIHQRVTQANKSINLSVKTPTAPLNLQSPAIMSQAAIRQVSNNAFWFLETFTPQKLRETHHNIPLETYAMELFTPSQERSLINIKP